MPTNDRTRRAPHRLGSSRASVIPPLSLHRFTPLPTTDISDGALIIMARYGSAAGVFYLAHGVWPRFAAPGCACGEAVLP